MLDKCVTVDVFWGESRTLVSEGRAQCHEWHFMSFFSTFEAGNSSSTKNEPSIYPKKEFKKTMCILRTIQNLFNKIFPSEKSTHPCLALCSLLLACCRWKDASPGGGFTTPKKTCCSPSRASYGHGDFAAAVKLCGFIFPWFLQKHSFILHQHPTYLFGG